MEEGRHADGRPEHGLRTPTTGEPTVGPTDASERPQEETSRGKVSSQRHPDFVRTPDERNHGDEPPEPNLGLPAQLRLLPPHCSPGPIHGLGLRTGGVRIQSHRAQMCEEMACRSRR